MEKKLSVVFDEISTMDKRLSDKKREVRIKINNHMTLLITYEELGKITVSSMYFKRGEKKFKNKMKYIESITSELLINGKTVDRRSVDSIEELNTIIREYINPVDARELLKTFAKKNGLKLKKKKYALPDEMYVFSGLVIRVLKNGIGTEFIIAYKRTPEEVKEDIITFGSYKLIQNIEELNELYNN